MQTMPARMIIGKVECLMLAGMAAEAVRFSGHHRPDRPTGYVPKPDRQAMMAQIYSGIHMKYTCVASRGDMHKYTSS